MKLHAALIIPGVDDGVAWTVLGELTPNLAMLLRAAEEDLRTRSLRVCGHVGSEGPERPLFCACPTGAVAGLACRNCLVDRHLKLDHTIEFETLCDECGAEAKSISGIALLVETDNLWVRHGVEPPRLFRGDVLILGAGLCVRCAAPLVGSPSFIRGWG